MSLSRRRFFRNVGLGSAGLLSTSYIIGRGHEAMAVEPGGALSRSPTLARKRSSSGSQVVNQTGVPCWSQSAA